MIDPVEYLEEINEYRTELFNEGKYKEVELIDRTVYSVAVQLGWQIEISTTEDTDSNGTY